MSKKGTMRTVRCSPQNGFVLIKIGTTLELLVATPTDSNPNYVVQFRDAKNLENNNLFAMIIEKSQVKTK